MSNGARPDYETGEYAGRHRQAHSQSGERLPELLLTLEQASSVSGLSVATMRYYELEHRTKLKCNRDWLGNPVFTLEQLAIVQELLRADGQQADVTIHKAPDVSPPRDAAGLNDDEEPLETPTGTISDQLASLSDTLRGLHELVLHAQGAHGSPPLADSRPETAETAPVWLEAHSQRIVESQERLQHRLDLGLAELSQAVEFLAEENKAQQVLLSRIIDLLGTIPAAKPGANEVNTKEPLLPEKPSTKAEGSGQVVPLRQPHQVKVWVPKSFDDII